MTREEAKQLLPVIQAYAEGKKIQVKCKTDSTALYEKWVDVTNPDLDVPGCYRVKPEPKYRPFKDTKECWQEMQKHQPFGWLKGYDGYYVIYEVLDNQLSVSGGYTYDYDEAMGTYTFADGTPFGVKEEE